MHYSYIPIKSLVKVLIFEYCKMFLCVCRMRWKPIYIFVFVKLGIKPRQKLTTLHAPLYWTFGRETLRGIVWWQWKDCNINVLQYLLHNICFWFHELYLPRNRVEMKLQLIGWKKHNSGFYKLKLFVKHTIQRCIVSMRQYCVA